MAKELTSEERAYLVTVLERNSEHRTPKDIILRKTLAEMLNSKNGRTSERAQ